uniref:Uncharacterized protein n=1 Tax=Rhizophora mucronata TaxID=61149 RepID=A0A2P2JBN4_RHIMU
MRGTQSDACRKLRNLVGISPFELRNSIGKRVQDLGNKILGFLLLLGVRENSHKSGCEFATPEELIDRPFSTGLVPQPIRTLHFG